MYEFYQIFQKDFFAKHLRVTASAKYPFWFVTSTSATKNVSFNLGYFKEVLTSLVILNIFETNTVNCLRTALCGSSRQSAVTKLIYC